jgi:phosphatidate cytidylyltransferase
VLAQRIVVGIIAAPLALISVYLGGRVFTIVVGAVAVICMLEFFRLLQHAGHRPLLYASFGASTILFAAVYFGDSMTWVGGAFVFLVVAGAVEVMLRPPAPGRLEDFALSVLVVLSVAWLTTYALRLRAIGPNGTAWVLLAMIPTWAYDTGAYFTGRAIGRHPFAAQISPKKTVEGVAGGLLCALIGGGLTATFSGVLAPPLGALVGLLVGVAAQTGDLAESFYKRQTGMKDSGTLLPGHGGVLDRVDGLLFSLPITYYCGIVILGLSSGS